MATDPLTGPAGRWGQSEAKHHACGGPPYSAFALLIQGFCVMSTNAVVCMFCFSVPCCLLLGVISVALHPDITPSDMVRLALHAEIVKLCLAKKTLDISSVRYFLNMVLVT